MLKFTQAQQELINNERKQHAVAHNKMRELHGDMLVGNSLPTPKDTWGMWDRTGIEVGREVLQVFNTLSVNSMALPIGKLVHYFQTVSDSGVANISIDGQSQGKSDQPVLDYHGTPLPIIDSYFHFGWRQVQSAQTEGYSLDPAAARNGMFKVAEKLESITLDGDSKIIVGGDQLYGLRNHPKRNTRTTGNAINGGTGANIKADVIATLKLLHDDNYRTPATIFMNWDDHFYCSTTQFSTAYGNRTILEELLAIPGIMEIVPASKVTASQIIAVIKDSRVVQVLNGMPMVTRALFRANPEDDYKYKVMAAAALEIKYDANDNCGIAVSTI